MGDLYIKNKKVSGTVSSASAVICKDKSGNKHTLQKVLDNRPVNNNLLINSNFANPVNQRGVVDYTNELTLSSYTIDRWRANGCSFKQQDGYIEIGMPVNNLVPLYFEQYIEISMRDIAGKNISISFETLTDVHMTTFKLPSNLSYDHKNTYKVDDNRYIELITSLKGDSECLLFRFCIESFATFSLKWAKVEISDSVTPYIPRFYAEELRLCKRYYQKVFVSVPISYYETNGITSTSTIPLEPMRIDKPTCDATGLAVISNGFATSDFKLNNCTVITSQNKFYCNFNKSAHGLTISNNVFIQGLLTMDAEL